MRGLGPHVLAGPGGLKGLLDAAQPACIKYVDPPDKPFLAPLTVGRIHAISEQKDLANPGALALAHADAVSKRADATGIRTWEGINELYKVWEDAELCARFQDYELERMRLLHQRGLNAAVLCVNTGWPRELPDGSIDWSGVDTLLRNLGPDDLLDVHEYWRPDGPRGSAHLSEVGRFFRCPYQVKIFISECGVDFSGGQRDGFEAHGVTPQQYAAQFVAARDIWATDPRWVGATPFTFGHFLGGDWKSFDWEPWWSAFVEAMKPISDAEQKPLYAVSVDLLARIIQGEAAPCDEALQAVAGCLAECLQRGDTEARTARRWNGKRDPSARALELARGILNGTVAPNGYYYCMSQTDVDSHGWVDGDYVVRCGVYANHLYREWPKEKK